MATVHILYNPLSGCGHAAQDAKLVDLMFDDQAQYYDMTQITDYKAFFQLLQPEDPVVIVGGDGTLHRFVNMTEGLSIPQEIFYYPSGTGNDFARDLGLCENRPAAPISKYLKELPVVCVNGKAYRFLNGVGFGIDGYCCEEGDRLRAIPGKKVNYTNIAIGALLHRFSARSAVVTVDGTVYTYSKVWIAPTMHGRIYGGGMIPTPEQDRLSPEQTLSVMLFHGAGRLRTLCIFPSIFQGKHVKHKKMVALHTGHKITVEFDRPTPLQIDGETICNVTSYTAISPKLLAQYADQQVLSQ